MFEEVIQPGVTWSHVLKRGTAVRITDAVGGANVGGIFYNAQNPTERYNMPDTLKAQHIARLTRGNVLYSDMGRILCSIVADTAGWHDPLSGCANAPLTKAKYGTGRYQERRNDCYKNAFDGFTIELAKYGLCPRDMAAPVNFFSKVVVEDGGNMRFVPGSSRPGAYVELRAEMNVLVILNTCQHPLDPNPDYDPKPVNLSVHKQHPPAMDDPCRISRPENERGFVLTERYFMYAGMNGKNLVTSPLHAAHANYDAIVPAGEPWIHEIQKGQYFRIVDVEGNQAADTLFYNAHDYEDRYSAQDTIREQTNIYLTTGTKLMSSRGNVLLTIVADTCGRHDTLGGACATESNMVRYAIDKRYMHACRQSFVKAALSWGRGLEKRDIAHNINFFMNVPVTPEGGLAFQDGVSGPGKYVEMRAEMDVLAVISNCPQLNNPCNAYNPTPIQVLIWDPAD